MRKALAIFVLSGALVFVLWESVVPIQTDYYRSVFDKRSPVPPDGFVSRRGRLKYFMDSEPEFVVERDCLYLRCRRVARLPLFMAVVKKTDEMWTVEKLHAFAEKHTEIKHLWPSPMESNLGVEWITKTGRRD